MRNLRIEVQEIIDQMVQSRRRQINTPVVVYDVNSTRTLGYYDKRDNSIHLNEVLLDHYKELYINEVVVHEMCHCIVDHMYPLGWNSKGKDVKPHGPEFKAVARSFGISGKASINLPGFRGLVGTKSKVHDYVCSGCMEEYELSTIRHNRVMRGQSTYSCGKCKSQINYKG